MLGQGRQSDCESQLLSKAIAGQSTSVQQDGNADHPICIELRSVTDASQRLACIHVQVSQRDRFSVLVSIARIPTRTVWSACDNSKSRSTRVRLGCWFLISYCRDGLLAWRARQRLRDGSQ
jgi:hypothetical protein